MSLPLFPEPVAVKLWPASDPWLRVVEKPRPNHAFHAQVNVPGFGMVTGNGDGAYAAIADALATAKTVRSILQVPAERTV